MTVELLSNFVLTDKVHASKDLSTPSMSLSVDVKTLSHMLKYSDGLDLH